MSITFRKRPDHTLSDPDGAKEPHLDLHSLDAHLQDEDDDDIPVLIPASASSGRQTGDRTISDRTAGGQAESDPVIRDRTVNDAVARDPLVRDPLVRDPLVRDPLARDPLVRDPLARDPSKSHPAADEGLSDPYRAAGTRNPALSSESQSLIRRRDTGAAVHIPPPASVIDRKPAHQAPAWEDEDEATEPVLMPAQYPNTTAPYRPMSYQNQSSQQQSSQQQLGSPLRHSQSGQSQSRQTQSGVSAPNLPQSGQPMSGQPLSSPTRPSFSEPPAFASSGQADSDFPIHPAPEDFAPFLNTARNTQGHPSKPELFVWSDDENDAFAQAARGDFTLNHIQPTAGRPDFDASLFRAPSRQDALASAVAPAKQATRDQTAAMQAEIDALVTELLDESHAYLKQRFLEEIPEIIAKYRANQ